MRGVLFWEGVGLTVFRGSAEIQLSARGRRHVAGPGELASENTHQQLLRNFALI